MKKEIEKRFEEVESRIDNQSEHIEQMTNTIDRITTVLNRVNFGDKHEVVFGESVLAKVLPDLSKYDKFSSPHRKPELFKTFTSRYLGEPLESYLMCLNCGTKNNPWHKACKQCHENMVWPKTLYNITRKPDQAEDLRKMCDKKADEQDQYFIPITGKVENISEIEINNLKKRSEKLKSESPEVAKKIEEFIDIEVPEVLKDMELAIKCLSGISPSCTREEAERAFKVIKRITK